MKLNSIVSRKLKVATGAAALMLMSAGQVSANDWHVLNLNNFQCVDGSKANPHIARQAGAKVTEITSGSYVIEIGGNSILVFDSLAKCEQAKKIMLE